MDDNNYSSIQHVSEEKPSSNPLWLWLAKSTVLIVFYGFVGMALHQIPALSNALTDNHGGLIGLGAFLIIITLIICVSGNSKSVIEYDEDDEDDEDEEEEEDEDEETTECEKCGDYLEVYDPKPLCADCAAEAKYWHDRMNPVKQENAGVNNA